MRRRAAVQRIAAKRAPGGQYLFPKISGGGRPARRRSAAAAFAIPVDDLERGSRPSRSTTTLPAERRRLFERYRLVDYALRWWGWAAWACLPGAALSGR
jgi:hypothetical protein